jgi:hypothetical protein
MYDRGTPRDLNMTNFYQHQLNQMNHQGNNGWHAPNFPGAVQGMHGFASPSAATGHQSYGFVGAPQNFSGSPHGYVGQNIGVQRSLRVLPAAMDAGLVTALAKALPLRPLSPRLPSRISTPPTAQPIQLSLAQGFYCLK